MQWSVEVFHTLKKLLKDSGYSTSVGDEGGFAPNFESDEQALQFIVQAIEKAGFKPGQDFFIAMDAAATELYEEAKKAGKEGQYLFWKNGQYKTREEMVDFWAELADKYPIISLEDGLSEDDWEGWKILTDKLGSRVQLVGDDLFVTNTTRISKGIDLGVSNSVLIKVNQIGTLTETLQAIEMSKDQGWTAIVSHRSGETEDVTIADIRCRDKRRSDQDRCAFKNRSRCQIQSAAAHRGITWRSCRIRRQEGFQSRILREFQANLL